MVMDGIDFIKIGIGSSQEFKTEKNPYPLTLRTKMIDIFLKKPPKTKYRTMGIPDVNSDEQWYKNVLFLAGDFDIVYTGNIHIRTIFQERGVKVKFLEHDVDSSGTVIRRLMKAGKPWEHLVPKETVKVLKCYMK